MKNKNQKQDQEEKLRFHNLEVWKLGMKLAHLVYKITKDFPKDEQYGLTSQIKRAANSVPLNIAEGTGRRTDEDFANFLRNSMASDLEVLNCSEIALQENFIDRQQHEKIEQLTEKIYFKLIALEKSVLNK